MPLKFVDVYKRQALIILDVMMPRMDGWQVCREVRQSSKVPIIMLTARSEERDELQGFALGVDEYISKPFSPKILVARVNAILRRANVLGGGDEIEMCIRDRFMIPCLGCIRTRSFCVCIVNCSGTSTMKFSCGFFSDSSMTC